MELALESLNFKQKLEYLRSGKLKCEENISYFLSNIKKNNEKYNICLDLNPQVIENAQKLDVKFQNGGKLGRFFGIGFILKSNISMQNMKISCASHTLENYEGSFDADIVKKIKEEDGLIIGIANNDEFASGSSGESSAFGKTINPKAPKRIPGGSSSGSAAAVAAKFCDVAFGTDTGGSIRNPASHCGIIGIKPSYGRVSRHGLVDLAMSLDQIGPFSNDVYASAYVMEVIAGWSENDPTTENVPVKEYSKENLKSKYKIGIIKSFNEFISDKRILELFEKKIEELKKMGADIVDVDIKNIELAVQAYYPIVYSEFFSGTRKFDGIKYGDVIENVAGEEVLRRILGGKEISRSEYDGAYYKKALKVKEIIAEEFERVFKDVDFLLLPTTPRLPHKFEDKLTPMEMYAYDVFTIPANLGGICAGVVSKDFIKEEDGEIPVGFQIFANKFKEDLLFAGLYMLEKTKKQVI